jgi:hypothetical protein
MSAALRLPTDLVKITDASARRTSRREFAVVQMDQQAAVSGPDANDVGGLARPIVIKDDRECVYW